MCEIGWPLTYTECYQPELPPKPPFSLSSLLSSSLTTPQVLEFSERNTVLGEQLAEMTAARATADGAGQRAKQMLKGLQDALKREQGSAAGARQSAIRSDKARGKAQEEFDALLKAKTVETDSRIATLREDLAITESQLGSTRSSLSDAESGQRRAEGALERERAVLVVSEQRLQGEVDALRESQSGLKRRAEDAEHRSNEIEAQKVRRRRETEEGVRGEVRQGGKKKGQPGLLCVTMMQSVFLCIV